MYPANSPPVFKDQKNGIGTTAQPWVSLGPHYADYYKFNNTTAGLYSQTG
jgi:hypothetical protein